MLIFIRKKVTILYFNAPGWLDKKTFTVLSHLRRTPYYRQEEWENVDATPTKVMRCAKSPIKSCSVNTTRTSVCVIMALRFIWETPYHMLRTIYFSIRDYKTKNSQPFTKKNWKIKNSRSCRRSNSIYVLSILFLLTFLALIDSTCSSNINCNAGLNKCSFGKSLMEI